MRRPSFSGLWGDRPFLTFWAARTVSAFGTQVTLLALPLTAALVLDADAAQMGRLVAAEGAPQLLVVLLAGAWVDRLRKRPVLIAADLGRAALLASVPVAHALGALRIELLYLVGFLTGTLSAFAGAASSPFLLAVVRRDRLLEANTKLGQSETAAAVAGPGLAGALVQVLTAPVAILADAASFVASALLVWRVGAEEPATPPSKQRQGVGREIAEGLRFVAGDRLLRALAGNNGTWAFFDGVVAAVLVLYVTRELGLRPGLVGVVFVGGPVGFSLGSLLLPRTTRAYGLGPVATWGAIVGSAGGLGYVLAGGPLPLAVAMLVAAEFTMGFGAGFYSITTGSLRQLATPDRLLGRMNASFGFLSGGMAPLGALTGGFLGEGIGLRPTLAVGAVGGVAAFLWVWFSPLRAVREQPEPAGTIGAAASPADG